MDKILREKNLYYGQWQMFQKDTGEYWVGYWDNKAGQKRRFNGRCFKTLKEAEDYWQLQVGT